MCTNFALTITEAQAGAEYGTLFTANESYYPYYPNKAQSPAKPYSLPNVVFFDADGRRSVRQMRWGFLASWAKTEFEGNHQPNARLDKIPSLYRSEFKSRRCLVPASAFFDFNAAKTRFRFSLPELPFFAFAGFYNVFRDELFTMTFVTAEPTPWFANHHNRQPVTLVREQYEQWLDPRTSAADLHAMLVPEQGELIAVPEPKKKAVKPEPGTLLS